MKKVFWMNFVVIFIMVGAIQNSVLAGTTKEAEKSPKSSPIIKDKVTKEYEDKGVNSLLVWTSQRVYMVVPLSEKYPLIRKNPLLFFSFVLNWNEERIENIELETLLKNKGFLNSQRRTVGSSTLDSFVRVDEIAGFSLAKLMLDESTDKFELAEKKREIIEELKMAYSKYREEYERYLKDTFTFVSCGAVASSSYPLQGNDGSVVWRNRPPIIPSGEYQGYFDLSQCRQVVESSDYNIDSEMFTKPLIDAYGKELGQLDYNIWLKVYFSDRYNVRIQAKLQMLSSPRYFISHPKWSKWQNAHIPLENAKTLFSGGRKAVEEILFTVKPVEGWITGHTDLTNFEIQKIEKYFYSVNSATHIFEVSIDRQKTLYFVEGHGEHSIDNTEGDGYSFLSNTLVSQGFNVKKLPLLTKNHIPDDADVVIIGGPKGSFSEGEKAALKRYLDHGGQLFLLLDPVFEKKVGTGLESFFAIWGVKLENGLILDTNSGLGVVIPTLNPGSYLPHELTDRFNRATFFPVARSVSFDTAKVEGYRFDPFLATSLETWFTLEIEGEISVDPTRDRQGPISFGGVFYSPKGSNKMRLVIIGDSDFGANSVARSEGNGDLFQNVVSWLASE